MRASSRCEPRGDRLPLVLVRLRLVGRRHLAMAQLQHDLVPALAMIDQRRDRRHRLEVQIVLVLLVAVAGKQFSARNGLTTVSNPLVDAAVRMGAVSGQGQPSAQASRPVARGPTSPPTRPARSPGVHACLPDYMTVQRQAPRSDAAMLRHPWFSQGSHRCRDLVRAPFVVLAAGLVMFLEARGRRRRKPRPPGSCSSASSACAVPTARTTSSSRSTTTAAPATR